MYFSQGTHEQVQNSHGKRAISVRATEVLLYSQIPYPALKTKSEKRIHIRLKLKAFQRKERAAYRMNSLFQIRDHSAAPTKT